MDDPTLEEREHHAALRGLERLNTASGSALHVWHAINPLFETSTTTVSLLDIATGSGDVPIALARLAAAKNRALQVAGADISERAVEMCRQRAETDGVSAEFFVLNALSGPIPDQYDVVSTSLFTHHLDPPDVVQLLRTMKNAARKLVIVNDLERSLTNWIQVYVATRLLSRSKVVHYDGPVSVRAAYTAEEFRDLAEQAGLSGSRVERRFPCRFVMTWSPP